MRVQLITPTGGATIYNAQSKEGQKAMLLFMQQVQRERVPFVVCPPGTIPQDLQEVTSIDALDY